MADEVKLIDRDEVGAKIQAMYIRREMDYGGENEFCRGMRKALRIIEDAPTVEPDNGWISVKDRLPDDKERYLICTEDGRIDIAYYQPIGDTFSEYEPFWQGSCRFTASVTHWQPLPEPPKGE